MYSHQLKPVLQAKTFPATGIGGTGESLGIVDIPIGISGINGIGQWTVLEESHIPPLTPVGLLKDLGTSVDLVTMQVRYGKLDKAQDLIELPSGHISHSICEFHLDGWTCDRSLDPQQAHAFRVKIGEPVSPIVPVSQTHDESFSH